ncbi:MAG: hypothetical protein A3E81_02035 [Gammaproteobacteria bacterium RIFCSPHIGHO2_12_FULL_36_30]|nr:MAG: hypothetical protein A3E81_02035 [Gammaproteobacteria bacterium RIFCSPHIGHO2_12_FULL_36_30]
MKRLLPTLAITLLCSASIYAAATMNTEADKLSYAMGFKTGQAMKQQSIVINTQDFTQGLQDGYTAQKPAISEDEMQATLTTMQQDMVKKMQQKFTEVSAKNLIDGQQFLAKNAKEAGVVTLPSGLQYKIITPGNGDSPTANDTVTVNYEGKLINGTVFDSSYKRGQPATFKVGQVIAGWQEALKLMKPGATWMLYIPANLAYGPQGSMGAIGPNEALIFKVDLISVKK